jgi:hypothetical protein
VCQDFVYVPAGGRLGDPDGLHVFPKIGLNQLLPVLTQQCAGKENLELPPAAMTAKGLPAGVALLDQATGLTEVSNGRITLGGFVAPALREETKAFPGVNVIGG